MRTNSGGITPLNWTQVVDEALRRRRAEGLTQREHAALANVSVPTLAAFERGETTLTLAKAFDILRVIGLIEEQVEGGAQESFTRAAFARWRALTSALPADSAARFPHGWYQFDYWLEGKLKALAHRGDQSTFKFVEFERILRNAVTRHTGWSPFWVPRRHAIAPQEVDGTIECWLAPGGPGVIDRAFDDAAHCDFWRAAPSGRMYLIRGYREDSEETFPPGTIFDTTLAIWRLGEALRHAENLASLLTKGENSPITVHFRAVYTGLSGRVLRSWANPLSQLVDDGHTARGDEVFLESVVPAAEITAQLPDHVFPLVSSLFERFGVTGVSEARISAELSRLLATTV